MASASRSIPIPPLSWIALIPIRFSLTFLEPATRIRIPSPPLNAIVLASTAVAPPIQCCLVSRMVDAYR